MLAVCAAGEELLQDGCTQCPKDSYSPGTQACAPCPDGKTSTRTGGVACEGPAGTPALPESHAVSSRYVPLECLAGPCVDVGACCVSHVHSCTCMLVTCAACLAAVLLQSETAGERAANSGTALHDAAQGGFQIQVTSDVSTPSAHYLKSLLASSSSLVKCTLSDGDVCRGRVHLQRGLPRYPGWTQVLQPRLLWWCVPFTVSRDGHGWTHCAQICARSRPCLQTRRPSLYCHGCPLCRPERSIASA